MNLVQSPGGWSWFTQYTGQSGLPGGGRGGNEQTPKPEFLSPSFSCLVGCLGADSGAISELMAKWGEGDPRWIVEERADATNVNNWHWYGPARQAAGALLTG